MPVERQSRSSQPAPVYVVCGREEFLKREAIRDITGRVLAGAERSLALGEYDGSSAGLELAEVLDDLRTLPFLTERRLVVLRDADTFITRYRAQIEAYLEEPCPTGVLLIECKALPANTRLYKRAAAIGEVVKCEPMKSRAIPAWLVSRCREAYGVQLSSQAAAMLCELVGEDLGLLDGELQKLSLYTAGQGRITAANVEAAVGQHREQKVWEVLSAIMAGNQARAMALWEEVWQTDRAAPARAIGGIAFTVRRLLNAKRAQEAGAPLNELARILMRWGDERRLQDELAAFSTSQVEGMLCRLLEADVAAKTGLASVRSSIEAFIIDMCRDRQCRRATG